MKPTAAGREERADAADAEETPHGGRARVARIFTVSFLSTSPTS
jgi:hypothetical protein